MSKRRKAGTRPGAFLYYPSRTGGASEGKAEKLEVKPGNQERVVS